MKTLIIVRHAKSSWDFSGIEDIDRPLNDRGKAEAPQMAKRLKEKGIKVDLFVSSPAKRAKKTAKYFAGEYGLDKKDIVLVDKLYEATVPTFYDVVESLDNKYDTVAVFSHNPGITEFVNTLTHTRIDDMPTCAVFAVNIDTDNWSSIKNSSKTFLFFDYPKNIES